MPRKLYRRKLSLFTPPKSLFAQKRHFITYCKFQIIYSGKTMSIYHVYTRSRPLCQASGSGCRPPVFAWRDGVASHAGKPGKLPGESEAPNTGPSKVFEVWVYSLENRRLPKGVVASRLCRDEGKMGVNCL